MFRYGGPIKEGVMSGIKEPQAINTVGSPIFPKSSERFYLLSTLRNSRRSCSLE